MAASHQRGVWRRKEVRAHTGCQPESAPPARHFAGSGEVAANRCRKRRQRKPRGQKSRFEAANRRSIRFGDDGRFDVDGLRSRCVGASASPSGGVGCGVWRANHLTITAWAAAAADNINTRPLMTRRRSFQLALCVLCCCPSSAAAVPSTWHNGVSIGGWLLMEPSWMYDVFSAPAEADFIRALRAAGGDSYAVQSMRNHWAGYVPEAALDALVSLGVTHARIPVGYWLFEAPVAALPPSARPPTMYDFGFNHEGFVTGGVNALEALLAQCKARGIQALIDLHALPGGASSCQSYSGWQVNQPHFWTGSPPATNTTPVAGACGGAGPYYTSRGDAATWMAAGETVLLAMADWIVGLETNAAMSGVVVGLEVANEPGLGFSGVQSDIERLLTDIVPKLQAKLASTVVNVTLNFVGPDDVGAGAWVAAQVKAGIFNGSQLLIDYHQYYNWDGPETWQVLAAKICGTTAGTSPWAQYTAAGLHTVIGEWSCSTNLGAAQYTDLTKPDIVSHLKTLYANQMSLFGARGGTAPGAVGQHHWALRMGSGWDPRPTADHPNGAQQPGSAWDASLPSFGPAVWSLGELIRHGIAQPLSSLNISGVCRCNGCSPAG